jgi:hypothetical protein
MLYCIRNKHAFNHARVCSSVFFIYLRRRPSLIEFLSYMFNFQGVLVGPLVFYKDYDEFITGENVRKYQVKKYRKYLMLNSRQFSLLKFLIRKRLKLRRV